VRRVDAADSIDEDERDGKKASIVNSRTLEKTFAKKTGCPKQQKKQI
jgi:hypothetical protein